MALFKIGDLRPWRYNLFADALDRADVGAACAGASVVYHCVNVPYPEWQAKLTPLMNNLIEGAANASAKLIYADAAS